MAPFLIELGAKLIVRPMQDALDTELHRLFVRDHSELFVDLFGARITLEGVVNSVQELGAKHPAEKYVFSHYNTGVNPPKQLAELPGATVQTRHGQVNGRLSFSSNDSEIMCLYDMFLAENERFRKMSEPAACSVVGNIPASYIGKRVVEKGYVPRGLRDSERVALVVPSMGDSPRDLVFDGELLVREVTELASRDWLVIVRLHPCSRALGLAGMRFSSLVSWVLEKLERLMVAGRVLIDWSLDSGLKYLNVCDSVSTDYSSAACQLAAFGVPVRIFSQSEDNYLKTGVSGELSELLGPTFVNENIVGDLETALSKTVKKKRAFELL